MRLTLRSIQLMCAALLAGLTLLIALAARESDVIEGFRRVGREWWGIVTLADLYAGLLLAACWIWVVEQRRTVALAWLVALMCLGNVATLVYVILRARKAESVAGIFTPPGWRRSAGADSPSTTAAASQAPRPAPGCRD